MLLTSIQLNESNFSNYLTHTSNSNSAMWNGLVWENDILCLSGGDSNGSGLDETFTAVQNCVVNFTAKAINIDCQMANSIGINRVFIKEGESQNFSIQLAANESFNIECDAIFYDLWADLELHNLSVQVEDTRLAPGNKINASDMIEWLDSKADKNHSHEASNILISNTIASNLGLTNGSSVD